MDADESAHCVRVLRHRAGDPVDVIDGLGTLYHCRLSVASPKEAQAEVLSQEADWHAHPYFLTVGCCPTKNNDRFEWFVEKATELGVDVIVPLIGDRSERRVYKSDRARRIALSATKQSLKARVPEIAEPVSVQEFVVGDSGGSGDFPRFSESGESSLRLIAYCFEDAAVPRVSIQEALAGFDSAAATSPLPRITVLIGPEGDFSPEEASLALAAGYIPIHLGPSRLRTETAAVTAVEAVYLSHC